MKKGFGVFVFLSLIFILSQMTGHVVAICTDSDGGQDYSVQGNITFNGQNVFQDYCFNDVFNTNTELKEGVCYGEDSWGELYYQCPNGCVNGACVNQTVNTKTCIETDGGKNYYTKGNITEVWSNGGKVGYNDICTDGNTDTASPVSRGIYLHETYCSGNEVSFEFYKCPNGCVNGACIQTTTKPTRLNASKSCTSGCIFDNRCYPMGYRKAGRYCSENSQFTSEVSNNGTCENNFECKSNLCIDNQCIRQGLMKKFFNWLRGSNRR